MDAEQSVLGGVMLSPKALARVDLSPDDFYRRDHQLIYRAIRELEGAGQPYDAVTIGEWFEAKGMAEMVGGGAYLVDLASNTPSAANIAAYVKIVRDKSVLRQAIEIGTSLVNAAFDAAGTDPATVLDGAIVDLMRLHRAEENHDHTLRSAVNMAFDRARAAFDAGGKLMGITTGLQRLDERLGGWNDSDLIFIGARPAMGKTALMVNLADAAASAGHKVGCISGEQSAMQYGQRAISLSSSVPAERLRNGNFEELDWSKMNVAIRLIKAQQMFLYDRSAPTIEEIMRTARRWKQEHDIRILFVDYLQRIRVPNASNRAEEVGEASRCLKDLARELNIPVVCLAQVVRGVENRDDKRPGLGDLANSDEASREADQILFLYRDEIYNENTNARGMAELNCEKNRHGPTGQFMLRFCGPTMSFTDPDAIPQGEYI